MCSQAPTWHLHPFLPISVPGVEDGGHLAVHSTGDVVQGEGPALITDLRPSVLLSGETPPSTRPSRHIGRMPPAMGRVPQGIRGFQGIRPGCHTSG